MCVNWEISCKVLCSRTKRNLSKSSWNMGNLPFFCRADYHNSPEIWAAHLFCLSDPFPSRVDPNRAAEGCQKTPMEIAIYNTIFSSCYKGGYFSILMLLAGFVNAETPPHTRLNILKIILERGEKHEFADEFKKNLDGLSVSEVRGRFCCVSVCLSDRYKVN